LYDALDLSQRTTAPANQPVLAQPLRLYQCPSTAGYLRVIPEYGANGVRDRPPAGALDYAGVMGIGGVYDQNPQSRGVWFAMAGIFDVGAAGYSFEQYLLTPPRLTDVDDGLTNTLMVVEQAGKPTWYWRGTYDFTPTEPTNGAWLAVEFTFLVDWPRVNEINATGIFSYHANLAHVLMCDGSVTSLSDQVAPKVIQALISRSNGELIRDADWR
jgi:prepilin-type processing-associated H-X9-DG protein